MVANLQVYRVINLFIFSRAFYYPIYARPCFKHTSCYPVLHSFLPTTVSLMLCHVLYTRHAYWQLFVSNAWYFLQHVNYYIASMFIIHLSHLPDRRVWYVTFGALGSRSLISSWSAWCWSWSHGFCKFVCQWCRAWHRSYVAHLGVVIVLSCCLCIGFY